MVAKLQRKLAACLSAIGVLALAVLPAEHVHSHSQDGRRSEVIHRHYEPHDPLAASARVDHHDDDDDAQYLSSAFTTPKPAPRVYPVDQFVIVAFATLQPHAVSWRRLPTLHISVHGPPWAMSHGLRGPPSLAI